MSNKTENKLTTWKKEIDEKDVPHKKLDDAILTGFNRAKNEKSPSEFNYKVVFGLTALFLFLVGCVATIWIINPELLADNKGLQDAMNYEYYQEINETKTVNGMKVTIQGAIPDEKGFALFYTIETDKKYQALSMDHFEIMDVLGNEIEWSSMSYGTPNFSEKGKKKFEGKIEVFSVDGLSDFDFVTSFELRPQSVGGVENKISGEWFEISFSIDEKKIAPKVEYALNNEVLLGEQKILFEKMIIYPLRAELMIGFDEMNSKKILDFPDLKMVDEAGEERGKIINGTNMSFLNEEGNKQIIYLQSNYFIDTEELYLSLNKIQALDKDELNVVVDIDEEKIVQQPASKKFTDFNVRGRHLEFTMKHGEEFPFGPFAYVLDEKGNEMDVLSSGMSQYLDGDNMGKYFVEIKGLSRMTGRLVLPLSFYPEWVEAEEEIRIKVY